MLQGGLFTRDWLTQGILETAPWRDLDDQTVAAARAQVGGLLTALLKRKAPVEAETEDKLVYPALRVLGWEHISVQQRMDARGRHDVPDALLFPNADADAAAAGLDAWQRFRHGAALVEAKRWNRPLDRAAQGDQGVPAAQVMHYLSRADVTTQGRMRWGILTNVGLAGLADPPPWLKTVVGSVEHGPFAAEREITFRLRRISQAP